MTGPGPQATGAQSIAVGAGSIASGARSVAIGDQAQAVGGQAVSIGAGNIASGNGAVAIGDPNIATGTGAVAMGANNKATGTGALAMGNQTVATGNGAVALGNNAQANAAGSVAIGDGAVANRANQVAIGTASTIHTLAGLGSAASAAAQVGPTRFTTSDSAGNLAMSAFSPADISALQADIATLQNGQSATNTKLGLLGEQVRVEARRTDGGLAAAMAMGGTMIPPDSRFALSMNVASYRGEQGFSASGVARLSDRIWANAGVAGSSVSGTTGARAGVTIGW